MAIFAIKITLIFCKMKKLVPLHTSLFAATFLLAGCSVGKFIPEGEYLLDEVHVESDNKEVKPSEMQSYVRQKPNAKWFSLVKLPMYIYSASGLDSTKWFNRFLRKIGDEPKIYSHESAEESRQQMQRAVQNKGYMGARVELKEVESGKKKKRVSYVVKTGQPYVISSMAYDIADYRIRDLLMNDSLSHTLKEGMRFDVNALEAERGRITQVLADHGYYRFNKDYITFQADTMLNTYKVDLTMKIDSYHGPNAGTEKLHPQYYIRNVNYVLDAESSNLSNRSLSELDSLRQDNLNIYYNEKKTYLRPKVISAANWIKPGQRYSAEDIQSTYSSLSRLKILKYSNIRFKEVLRPDSSYLDAYAVLSRNKNQSVAFEIEGTNSAGDLGAAASVAYSHRNLFRGSETFTAKVRGAYEAITGLEGYANSNYTEYGVETSLNFPQFVFPFLSSDFKRNVKATSEVSVKYNWQIRPEFERTLAAASWSYKWNKKRGTSHRLDLLDINYIYMPYRSEQFREYLNRMDEINPLLRYSYEDLFILRLGYTYTYNSSGMSSTMQTARKSSYSIRFNIEESGNLTYGISKILHPHPRHDEESYQIGNISFAQYVKADFDFAKNFVIDERNAVVFHVGLGIAYPYGNSKSLPFEKLYFSGGANSVRGWSVRSLGPGSYRGNENSLDYVNHTGDLKLDLNLEYRTHLFWKLKGAAFVDAGNVWTLKKRDSQSLGQFEFDRFYKQIAMSYGLGIRLDLDFLIIRFDGGMKAINPMETGKKKYPLIRPDFSRDFAFHFAVGYPF